MFVSFRQNGVGPEKNCADAILPKGHIVFAVSPPLIEAGLKFEQIVRNVIHRIPPKIRSGIDGNDSRKGAHKSGAIAESE